MIVPQLFVFASLAAVYGSFLLAYSILGRVPTAGLDDPKLIAGLRPLVYAAWVLLLLALAAMATNCVGLGVIWRLTLGTGRQWRSTIGLTLGVLAMWTIFAGGFLGDPWGVFQWFRD